MLQQKEAIIEKLSDDNAGVAQRLDALASERQKYMGKVETILTEQKELRAKDQTLFNQVSQARDSLHEQLSEKDAQIEQRDSQIFNLSQSIQELQLMLQSLRGIQATQNEAGLQQKIKAQELRIEILKKEVETATDFLLE